MINIKENEKLNMLNHSCAHLLAHAVKHLYPSAKFWVGPVIEEGFYYDIDLGDKSLTEEDLPLIEKEMKKISKDDKLIKRLEISKKEALDMFKDDVYKVDLISRMEDPDTIISAYQQEDFIDLCRGPHVNSTKELKYFKLLKVSGAYWKGDSKNKMLQRIYGICFDNEEELNQYLLFLEEAKKRDHRKLGKELDLFSIDPYVGSGLILWHPKLSIVREEIELYWRKEHRKRGYEYVYTPHVGMSNLWETSGHLKNFAAGMYPPMKMSSKDELEDATYYVKPMSCPFHVRIYKSRLRSYKELPIKYCELGTVYRFEPTGALHGMLRVRGFTQDDAHLICTEEQFKGEVNKLIDFAIEINKTFGFDNMKVYLSVRDLESKEAKYIDNEPVWQLAEQTLEQILVDRNIEYKKDIGGAKFYGPAIDMKVLDSLGREWQGTTIQLDMNLPERFGMKYIGSDGQEHTPVMVHRTVLGSMERFVGTLIEHYAGAFPLWLAPVQLKVLPVNSEFHMEYASKIFELLKDNGFRVEIDDRNEKLGYKMREAQTMKIPYSVIIGEKERDNNTISYREFGKEDTTTVSVEEFILMLNKKISDKK